MATKPKKSTVKKSNNPKKANDKPIRKPERKLRVPGRDTLTGRKIRNYPGTRGFKPS